MSSARPLAGLLGGRFGVGRVRGTKPRRLFRFYARLDRVDDWFERRFTGAGRVVLWSAIAAALFSVDMRRTLAYQLLALAVVMVLFSLSWTMRRWRAPAQFTRQLPAMATAGEPLRYRVSVSLARGSRLESLWLRERLSAPLPDERSFQSLHEPGARSRNWFDRKLGFPRWMWLKRRAAGARVAGVDVALTGQGPHVVRLELLPLRRGYIELCGLTSAVSDPLGLCRRLERRALPGRVLVLPRRYDVPSALLPGSGHRFDAGGGLSMKPGHSDEFLGVREFKPGDTVRHIHWKRFASLGVPIVREFQAETSMRLAVVLDTAGALSGSPLFEEAVSIAASLVQRAQLDQTRVELLLPGRAVGNADDGMASLELMLSTLACVDGAAPERLADFAGEVLERRHLLPGVLCVLLGFDAQRRAFVETLRAAGMRVRVIAVLASGASAPPDEADVRYVNVGEAAAQLQQPFAGR